MQFMLPILNQPIFNNAAITTNISGYMVDVFQNDHGQVVILIHAISLIHSCEGNAIVTLIQIPEHNIQEVIHSKDASTLFLSCGNYC